MEVKQELGRHQSKKIRSTNSSSLSVHTFSQVVDIASGEQFFYCSIVNVEL